MSQRRAATRMRMFADIERMDAHAWASYLAPDAVMRVGNGEPVYGRDGCRSALEAFYARIDGLRYDLRLHRQRAGVRRAARGHGPAGQLTAVS